MNFERLVAFEKEFNKLTKRYRSLPMDLDLFQKVLKKTPLLASNNAEIVADKGDLKIVKSRFFCRYLRGSSLRIVYAYHLKVAKICFIEIYFKGEKANEDRQRIREYGEQWA